MFTAFYKNFSIVLLCFIFFNLCYANPPSTVWRADDRPPDIIFKEGFSSYGNNRDFVEHIVGESCSARNSAFVSTTADQTLADDWALYGLMKHQPAPTHYYIYEIRATNNFYNAVDTLNHLEQTTHLPNAFAINYARRVANTQAEYSALTRIEPQQIRSVTIMTINSSGRPVRTYMNNPNYTPADTHANAGPYTGSDQLPPENLSIPMVTGEPPATACFVPPDELAAHPHFEPFLLRNFWID